MMKAFQLLTISRTAVYKYFIILFIFCGMAGAATNHNTNINADETWTKADGPHYITANVNVTAGTLTIEAGTTVYFDALTQLQIKNDGQLMATGTSGSHIIKNLIF